VIAAAASATAAIVISHIWKGGTVIAAAMTPVIVAIVKEMLAKPLESELVKKPVAKLASGSRAVVGTAAGARAGRSQSEQRGHGDPLMDGDSHEPPTRPRGAQTDPGLSPIRTYGGATPRRRPRIHLKVALITGIVAFAIAAAALTLPELIFGGAISSGHSTTLFGGGGSSTKNSKNTGNSKNQSTTSTQPSQSQRTTPATPPPTTGTKTPTTTTPQQTTPQQQTPPQQTTPQQSSPVPTTPTPPAP
jgi:hypothetical protein